MSDTLDLIRARAHPAQALVERWAFEGLGHYSRRFNYLYWVTPKAACSSILMTLHRLERDDPTFLYDTPFGMHELELSPLDRARDHIERFDDLGTFKFCFVRNPYDRLLSAWLDKVVRTGGLRPRFEAKLGREGPVSFADFVAVIRDEPLAEMDTHYAPQAYVTFQDMIAYDFIGRFETLTEDLRTVFGRLNADVDRFLAEARPHQTGAKPWDQLTPALKQDIQTLFAVDFARFGYDPEAPPDGWTGDKL